MASTLFAGAAQILTSAGSLDSCLLTDTSLVLADGVVARTGSEPSLRAEFPDAEQIDCRGCVITPGLIDSHTHAVFGGWRAAEYEMRSRGLPYMEIARRGGGINASVRDVRSRSEDELLELSVPRVQAFASLGVTTVEIKSGYGLSTEHELKMLRIIRRLREHVPIRIAATFLGAHDFPPEYQDRRNDYVDLLVNEMIPAVAESKLATFCDAFVEPGAFSADQARRVLLAGLEYGLIPRLHADEFENAAGAELAAELGAASADHLGAISTTGIEALAASKTVATLLPATLVFLGKTGMAPARALIDAGVTVALASDFNPGTAPTPNLSLSLTFACSKMGMLPLEALVAVTAGGARALRLPDNHGTLAPGAPGDLVVWGTADHREIPYRFGSPPVREVWASGCRIV